MELRHLRYFVTVADELHFTRAAARLRIAQPPLSRQIRDLERELGCQLFVRNKRSVKLTDAGQVLLERARRLLDDADQARIAVQQAAQGHLGRLAIGFVPFAATQLLPDVLTDYRAHHPHVDVELHELHTGPQVDALLNGKIHLGLISNAVDEPRLEVELLQRQRLVIAMSASHPLAKRRSLRLSELSNERWITGGTDHTDILYGACARAGFAPLIARQATGLESRLMLVASGVGLALTGESSPRPPGGRLAYRRLERPKITVDLAAAWPKGLESPLISGFLETVRSTAKTATARHT